jgi:hypothetical protein
MLKCESWASRHCFPRRFELWAAAQIEATELCEITVQRTFANFEEFWATTTLAASLQPTLATMAAGATKQLKTRVQLRLPADATGKVVYPARANAIKGRVPT